MHASAATSHEEACGRVAARFRERWLHHYVAKKLRADKVFAAVCELLRDSPWPILDVGCGVGLLPFYLRERGLTQPITALEIEERKVRRAREAATERDIDVAFHEQDVRAPLPNFSGNVTLLDMLHYVDPAAQENLLREIAARVPAGGLVLIRDCPDDGSVRFWLTYFGERFAQAVCWNLAVPLHFATRESINAPFPVDDFAREERPMFGGGPFNNRLFIFRRL